MTLYLTGFTINFTAILTLTGYYMYYTIKKKEPAEPRHYVWSVILLIFSVSAMSLYFLFIGDLMLASILVWVMAVPVLVTCVFILLIIIFRPDWR